MELKIHQFDSAITSDELYQMGEMYIRRFFVKRENGQRVGFCKLTDGRSVNYSTSNNYHFLDKENCGKSMLMRIQRIHWIIPILQETADENILKDDKVGDRIYYYLPQLKYLIMISYEKDYSLWLNTAYRVTDRDIRLKLNILLGR
jgi:hypothetical protein